MQPFDATALMRAWSGRTIATYTGARNRILDVSGTAVRVGTTSSPSGRDVPLDEVQHALDRLAERGRLRIDVETLGHRSAFCGAVLLTIPGAVRVPGRPQEVALHRPRRAALIDGEDRGAIAPWWERDVHERYWMEITDRPDVGTDLHCPQRDAAGRANPGYSTIAFVRADDVVFHYERGARAVRAWSRVAGTLDEAPIDWTSHRAETRRRLGDGPNRQPGWAIDLEGPFLLERAVTLDALRGRGAKLLGLLDRLRAEHGSIYAPFYAHGSARELRPTQYYLNKLPAGLLPLLREFAATPEPPAASGVGGEWRDPGPAPARKPPRTLELDFEAIERGTAGHRAVERRMAAALRALGIKPLRPVAGDPNFDIAWRADGVFHVAEIKSATARNCERQLRLGLGQVLRYRHRLAQRLGEPVRAVLVPEREPDDPTWTETCAAADVALLPAPRIGAELRRLLADTR